MRLDVEQEAIHCALHYAVRWSRRGGSEAARQLRPFAVPHLNISDGHSYYCEGTLRQVVSASMLASIKCLSFFFGFGWAEWRNKH